MYKIAGVLFFFAGATILLGIVTAEIFYPTNYSISLNMISNLAATPPPHSIISEPSANIFNISLILAGCLILIGIYFLHKMIRKKMFAVAATFLGLGTLGVGIFPAYHAIIHPWVALLAFLGGGVAALLSSRLTQNPFSSLAMMLGGLSLFFLFLGLFFPRDIIPILGKGGTERFVLYPLVLWLTGLGGYLMSYNQSQKKR